MFSCYFSRENYDAIFMGYFIGVSYETLTSHVVIFLVVNVHYTMYMLASQPAMQAKVHLTHTMAHVLQCTMYMYMCSS